MLLDPIDRSLSATDQGDLTEHAPRAEGALFRRGRELTSRGDPSELPACQYG